MPIRAMLMYHEHKEDLYERDKAVIASAVGELFDS